MTQAQQEMVNKLKADLESMGAIYLDCNTEPHPLTGAHVMRYSVTQTNPKTGETKTFRVCFQVNSDGKWMRTIL